MSKYRNKRKRAIMKAAYGGLLTGFEVTLIRTYMRRRSIQGQTGGVLSYLIKRCYLNHILIFSKKRRSK